MPSLFGTRVFAASLIKPYRQIYTAADGKKPGPIQHQMANRLNLSQSHKAKPCQFFKVTLCQIFVACSGRLVRVALEKNPRL